jgi:hypothetical protein
LQTSSRRVGTGWCGGRSTPGGRIGSRGQHLCARGFAQVGAMIGTHRGATRADRRPIAPERRGPAVKVWAGVPCERRRIRDARWDQKSLLLAGLPAGPMVPPRRSSPPVGERAPLSARPDEPVSASASPSVRRARPATSAGSSACRSGRSRAWKSSMRRRAMRLTRRWCFGGGGGWDMANSAVAMSGVYGRLGRRG